MDVSWENLVSVVFAMGVALLGFYLARRGRRRQKDATASSREAGQDFDPADLNRKFLDHAGEEKASAFIRIHSEADLMIIRSLLDSMGILSYHKPNSLDNLYPGLSLNSDTDSTLYLFEKDIPAAKEAVADFGVDELELLV